MQQTPIFIVSLRHSERRAFIGAALERLQASYSFVDGVVGADLSEAELAEVYDSKRARRLFGGDLSRGEIGASLTHREIYRRIVRDRIPGALVLEDDATLGSAFGNFLEHAPALAARNGIILLFSANGWVWRRPSFSVGDHLCHRTATRVTHAVGYWISLSAAEKLVEITQRVFWTPDWPAERWQVPFYVTIPFVIGHGAFASQVDGTRIDAKKSHSKWRRRPKFLSARYYDRALIEGAKAFAPGLFIDLKSVTYTGDAAK